VWGAFLVTGLDKMFDFSDNVMTALATLQLEERNRNKRDSEAPTAGAIVNRAGRGT